MTPGAKRPARHTPAVHNDSEGNDSRPDRLERRIDLLAEAVGVDLDLVELCDTPRVLLGMPTSAAEVEACRSIGTQP